MPESPRRRLTKPLEMPVPPRRLKESPRRRPTKPLEPPVKMLQIEPPRRSPPEIKPLESTPIEFASEPACKLPIEKKNA